MDEKKHVKYAGRLVFVGFGSIGQGCLPLLLRHIDMPRERICIITGDERGAEEAKHFGISHTVKPLTPTNYRPVLNPLVGKGDFLLNLSVDVSSVALIEYCYKRGVMYLDTCIEPWVGGYTDSAVSASRRSNYGLREEVLALRRKHPGGGPTVIPTHGANPGLISHWVKQALVNLARDIKHSDVFPKSREEWARLAMELGVKVIHCAERDTQTPNPPQRPGQFVNAWSVDGFVGEGTQPCELGWGTHEKHFPRDGKHHDFGCKAAIYLTRPGASVRVRSWTPMEGHYHGFLITHGEAISISDFYTVHDGRKKVVYRPTCHYAYHPCDNTVLSVHEARKLAPFNNATSLQVAAGVMGAVIWAMENPRRGICDPDDLDFQRGLRIAHPALGKVVGAYTDWTPLKDRGRLFPEDVDTSDPWQFKNFRVV